MEKEWEVEINGMPNKMNIGIKGKQLLMELLEDTENIMMSRQNIVKKYSNNLRTNCLIIKELLK